MRTRMGVVYVEVLDGIAMPRPHFRLQVTIPTVQVVRRLRLPLRQLLLDPARRLDSCLLYPLTVESSIWVGTCAYDGVRG